MAGNTENTDILTALNQVIEAINDLVLQSNCSPTVTPVINVTNQIIDNSGVGEELPIEDETLGATSEPQTGFTDPVDPTACKRAHWHYDGLYQIISDMRDNNVIGLLNLGIGAVIFSLGLLFGKGVSNGVTSIGLGYGVQKVAGYFLGIFKSLGKPEVDLSAILLVMSQNRDDIICAIYGQAESGTVGSTRAAVDTVLANAGLSMVNRGVVLAVYCTNWAMTLFHDALAGEVNATEIALANYTPVDPIDCATCPEQPDTGVYDFTLSPYTNIWDVTYGTRGTGQWQSGAGYRFDFTSEGAGYIYLESKSPVTLGQVKLTSAKSGGNNLLGHIYYKRSDDGENWSDVITYTYPETVHTSADLGINAKYLRIEAECTMPPGYYWRVSKIEFL